MPNTSASLESRDWSACRIENITHYNSFPFSLPLCSCILFSLLTVCRLSDDGNVILMIIDIERRRCWSGKLKCDAEIEESEMWHENYWEKSHCLASLFTRLFSFAIKYLQLAFIVELIAKWKFQISKQQSLRCLIWYSRCAKNFSLLQFQRIFGVSDIRFSPPR